ncbi:MAG: hypothetical protein HY764_00930 [Candidatus Portnoybacteria bacterium]|nr:hypothetical protein [Candidatus Portnoybacteria bacterium]
MDELEVSIREQIKVICADGTYKIGKLLRVDTDVIIINPGRLLTMNKRDISSVYTKSFGSDWRLAVLPAPLKIDGSQLKDFFFKASISTYASGASPEALEELPNAERYFWCDYADGKRYEYRDTYFSVGNGRSFGFTIISFDKELVWWMRYGGQCIEKYVDEQKTTAFLKKALLKAYKEKLFLGGRGEIKYVEGNLIYRNLVGTSEFESFKGREIITRISSPELVFYHDYEGGVVKK